MKNTLAALTGMLLFLCGQLFAQTAPTDFTFIHRPADTKSYSVAGYGNDYSTSTTYNIQFGLNTSGVSTNDIILSGFRIGTQDYLPITLPNGECYNKVVVNRVANSNVSDMDKQTLFFEYDGAANGTRYFRPTYTNIQEAVNTRIVNRGSDNVFANTGGETLNNIERIDLIITGGVFTPDNTKSGFIINERGGNDDFKVAAITGLDGSGNVSSVGGLVSVGINDWGNTNQSIHTTVFQRNSTDQFMRPNQNLPAQHIHSVFINYDELGISNNQTIYGIAIFPGDVTSSMDLIGLTDVPLDTDASSNDNGGLDMMGGGGYFGSEDVLVSDLQVDITASNMNPGENDIVDITVSVNNNGPLANSNIDVTVNIPTGYSFMSLENGYTGTAAESGGTINWSFDPLAKDDDEDLIFKVKALSDGERTFTSTVSGTLTDVAPGNNDDNLMLDLNTDDDPLPVSMIEFKAESRDNKNIISWITASEINNDYFELQKSTNNEDFQPLANIRGAGNSNEMKYYSFSDVSIGSAVSYYRLKQVDYDGQHEIYGPVVVRKSTSKAVRVYPNPTNGELFLENVSTDMNIRLYDRTGRTVISKRAGENLVKLDVSDLPQGMYFLHISTKKGVELRKVLVE